MHHKIVKRFVALLVVLYLLEIIVFALLVTP